MVSIKLSFPAFQPVTYVCRNRSSNAEYFYIVFEIIDEEVIAKKDGGHLAQERKEEEEKRGFEHPDEKNTDDLGVD